MLRTYVASLGYEWNHVKLQASREMIETRRFWLLFFYDYFCPLPSGMKSSSLAWMRCWYKSRTNHRTEMRGAWQITASWNYITLNLWENNLPYQATSPKLAPADWSRVYLSRKPFESFVCLEWRYLVSIFPWDFSFTEPYFWYLTPTLIQYSFLYCPRRCFVVPFKSKYKNKLSFFGHDHFD